MNKYALGATDPTNVVLPPSPSRPFQGLAVASVCESPHSDYHLAVAEL